MPIGGQGALRDISLHAGLSGRFGPVTLVPPFLLRAPGTTPPGAALPPSLPSTRDDAGPQVDPSLPLVLPPSLPRLQKTVLLDRGSGMELGWTVGEGEEWVDVQVGREGGREGGGEG
jgi:hypothetical protein